MPAPGDNTESTYLIDKNHTALPNLLAFAVHLTVHEPVELSPELAVRSAVVPVRALAVAVPPVLAGKGVVVLDVGRRDIGGGEGVGLDGSEGAEKDDGEHQEDEEGVVQLRHGLWQLNDLCSAVVDLTCADWSQGVGMKGRESGEEEKWEEDELSRKEGTCHNTIKHMFRRLKGNLESSNSEEMNTQKRKA